MRTLRRDTRSSVRSQFVQRKVSKAATAQPGRAIPSIACLRQTKRVQIAELAVTEAALRSGIDVYRPCGRPTVQLRLKRAKNNQQKGINLG